MIKYQKIQFTLTFEKSIALSVEFFFLLRGVFGKQLRSLTCIARENDCQTCEYNSTCCYAYVFETILDKNNAIQQGVNRGSHPFIFQIDDFSAYNVKSKTITFAMILLNSAINYLAYIYAAFVRAGEKGIFTERIPFAVTYVGVNNQTLLQNKTTIKVNTQIELWNEDIKKALDSSEKYSGEILIQFLMPLRFKVRGQYNMNFSPCDFFLMLFRRLKTLLGLYGDTIFPENISYRFPVADINFTQKNLQWQDNGRYSARQKQFMILGGVIGNFTLSGTFTKMELLLLEFAKIFNAGKNTSFGLGQINYWTHINNI